jgi:hypothetical protein
LWGTDRRPWKPMQIALIEPIANSTRAITGLRQDRGGRKSARHGTTQMHRECSLAGAAEPRPGGTRPIHNFVRALDAADPGTANYTQRLPGASRGPAAGAFDADCDDRHHPVHVGDRRDAGRSGGLVRLLRPLHVELRVPDVSAMSRDHQRPERRMVCAKSPRGIRRFPAPISPAILSSRFQPNKESPARTNGRGSNALADLRYAGITATISSVTGSTITSSSS